MNKRYYFDTGIWLDFLENRNEPNFPKGNLARSLVERIIKKDDKIIISDNNITELNMQGYPEEDIRDLFDSLKHILFYVESTYKEIKKSNDLAIKRGIPKRDSLHALIARNNNAQLITFDNHFRKLSDIIKPKTPKDFI
tara:strand:- start:218 stop:634 length:417 start_codon:yes stop_codon:yes gene_type:complete